MIREGVEFDSASTYAFSNCHEYGDDNSNDGNRFEDAFV